VFNFRNTFILSAAVHNHVPATYGISSADKTTERNLWGDIIMGFNLNDIQEYNLEKCHELRIKEIESYWSRVGFWLAVAANIHKTK
jgi:hypothetical protein